MQVRGLFQALFFGSVAERFNAPALKPGGSKGPARSNRATSANDVRVMLPVIACSSQIGFAGLNDSLARGQQDPRKAVTKRNVYLGDPGGYRDQFRRPEHGHAILRPVQAGTSTTASGETGIHGSLKNFCPQGRAGSNPALPTIFKRAVAQMADAPDLKSESSQEMPVRCRPARPSFVSV